ncbi:MAG: rhomboid family intramembrane serine protease [Bdellovibrionota bacterium]
MTLQPPKIGPGVKFLLGSLVVVFVLQNALSKFAGVHVEALFGFSPDAFLSGSIWQILTYPFLHGGLFHALFNAVFIYMLGSEFERRWGTSKFLKYYFICGIGGALLQLLVSFVGLYLFPDLAASLARTPIIGASGAIYGLFVAFGLVFGDTYVLLFFVLPIKAKHFVAIITFIALFSAVFYLDAASGGDVAHLVHLGGLITGFLYLRWKGPNLTGGGRGGKRKMTQDEVRKRLSLVVNNDEKDTVGDQGMPITWN